MKRIGSFIFQIWVIGATLSVPYYNWQYAREHGFVSWLFLGEVVATGKGIGWPYFWLRGVQVGGVLSLSALEEIASKAASGDAEALATLNTHADNGYPEAQRYLGVMYLFGEGLPKDATRAEQLLRTAASQSDVVAQYFLGMIYFNGENGPKDYGKAESLFRLAATNGHSDAQGRLGQMYFEGFGVAQDYATGVKWYKLAAAQGNPRAQYALGLIFATGVGIEQDDMSAYIWLNLAAAQVSDSADRDEIVAARDRVAERLSPEELSDAQLMANVWTPTDWDDLKIEMEK